MWSHFVFPKNQSCVLSLLRVGIGAWVGRDRLRQPCRPSSSPTFDFGADGRGTVAAILSWPLPALHAWCVFHLWHVVSCVSAPVHLDGVGDGLRQPCRHAESSPRAAAEVWRHSCRHLPLHCLCDTYSIVKQGAHRWLWLLELDNLIWLHVGCDIFHSVTW